MSVNKSGQDRTAYALALCKFLGYSLDEAKQRLADRDDSSGEVYFSDWMIEKLEANANVKSTSAENVHSSVGQRIMLARDYLGLTSNAIAAEIGVEPASVEAWFKRGTSPSKLEALASLLRVPVSWLSKGSLEDLPADSHVGVCCGPSLRHWLEYLFGMTQAAMSELIDSVPTEELGSVLEQQVRSNPHLAAAARRCGGRWKICGSALRFVPWADSPMAWVHQGV